MSQQQQNHEIELLLAKAVMSRDADALRSLIETRASDDDLAKIKRIYPKVAALLAPEEQEWLRILWGGKKDSRSESKSFEVHCTKLVSILEISNLLGFPYFEFREFLLLKNYKVYAMKKGDRVVAEGTPFATLAIACLGFCVKRPFR